MSDYWKIYMLNESLLDDVDVDEVTDADTDNMPSDDVFDIDFVIELYAVATYNSRTRTSIESIFRKTFSVLTNNGSLKEYTCVQNMNVTADDMKLFGSLVGIERDIDSFNDILLRLAATVKSVSAYETIEQAEIYFKKSLYGDYTRRLKFFVDTKTGDFSFDIYELYSNEFGVSDFEVIAKSVLKSAKKFDMVHWINSAKNRLVMHSSTDKKLFLIDDNGNCIKSISMERSVFMKNRYKFFFGSNGLMVLCLAGGCYNVMDESGEFKLTQNYSNISDYHDGVAIVFRNVSPHFNFIDSECKFKSTDWYEYIDEFNDGISMARLKDGQRYIDVNNNDICGNYRIDGMTDDKKYIHVCTRSTNLHNYIVVDGVGSKDENGVFCNPLAWNGKWFSGTSDYYDGYAAVKKDVDEWNILSLEEGRLILKKDYKKVGRYFRNSDICSVMLAEHEWNFIDIKTGKLLFDECFPSCMTLYGYGRNYKVGKKFNGETLFNFVNVRGELVFDTWKVSISPNGKDCLVVTEKDNGHYISKHYTVEGKFITDGRDIDAYGWNIGEFTDDGFSTVTKYEKEGSKPLSKPFYNIIDTDGNYMSDEWFRDILKFDNGYWTVKIKNSNYNILSARTRQLVLPKNSKSVPEYTVVEPNECIVVKNREQKFNAYNSEGKPVLSDYVDEIISFVSPGVLKVGMSGFVDYDGNAVSVL